MELNYFRQRFVQPKFVRATATKRPYYPAHSTAAFSPNPVFSRSTSLMLGQGMFIEKLNSLHSLVVSHQ